MIGHRILLYLFLCSLAISANATDKRQARVVRIGDLPVQEMRVQPRLSTADTCHMSSVDSMIWQIDSWVVGNELYKSYFDPSKTCTAPYPFAITEINLPMSFAAAGELLASVDVETVALTDPNCPAPGELLSISSQYPMTIPGAGLYSIWVPLDTPVIVNGPFFAGFFIDNALDPYLGAAVITNESPAMCTSYNIWDTTIGFVDLNNNEFYNFPGRLCMEVSGIPGGSAGGGTEPEPLVDLVSPSFSDTLLGTAELWAREQSGSEIIDYLLFEFSLGGSFIEIGRDYDGTRPLRGGSAAPMTGTGFSQIWDFSLLPEGLYTLKITAVDTLGRSASATTLAYLEPTPPITRITSPANGANFCNPVDILMSGNDANLPATSLFYLKAKDDYSLGLSIFRQSDLGDVNGNIFDGNMAANGEFGDYYSAPAAAVAALKVWYDRGHTYLYTPPEYNLAEQLATSFKTRENLGTYDEDVLRGLYDYFLIRGNNLRFDHRRNPDYFTLRTWLEYDERSVMIGLGGTASTWLALDGFTGWEQSDSSYFITAGNPATGTVEQYQLKNFAGQNRLFMNGLWQPIDIAISIVASNWVPTRNFIGVDQSGSDGWKFTWDASLIAENENYFIRSEAIDATNIRGLSTVLARFDCSGFYTPGDFNGDNVANFVDLNILIDLVTRGGAAPVGGIKRCDCNCDNYVNMADVVYYLNYLFGTVGPPCY